MAKKQTKPAEPAAEPAPEPAAPADATPQAEADQHDPLDHLQAVAAESYERLSESAAQLTEQARNIYATGQNHVRENPLGYVLGAFAFGCLLGVLLGRDGS